MSQSTQFPQLQRMVNRRNFLGYGSIALGSGLLTACLNQDRVATPVLVEGQLDRVNFIESWVSQAEHGGFHQAVATGIYKTYGLDVNIIKGGPRMNANLLLLRGAVDLIMGYGADALKALETGIPKITVAAIFQKDPQVLIAHPDVGVNSLEDLRDQKIYISSAAEATFWPFLKLKYGFTDEQKRPYTFDPTPFIEDKESVQQGFITSEPFAIEKQGGFKPTVMLLADYGFSPYSITIETTRTTAEKNPDLVQRFVDASIKGWYSYLAEPTPGNEFIKQSNREMADDQIAYSFEKMKEYRLIDSGDAEKFGIGAMSDKRWQTFFDDMVQAGVYDENTNYKDAYTLEFVNKGLDYYGVS